MHVYLLCTSEVSKSFLVNLVRFHRFNKTTSNEPMRILQIREREYSILLSKGNLRVTSIYKSQHCCKAPIVFPIRLIHVTFPINFNSNNFRNLNYGTHISLSLYCQSINADAMNPSQALTNI